MVAVAAVACVALVPLAGTASAAKKSQKVSFKLVGKLTATSTVEGKVTGKSPIGKGTYKGTVDYPNATYTLKLKGGTIKFSEVGTLDGTIAKGKWKVLKGTGKFKGAKGGGTSLGDITKQAAGFTYTGKVKF